MRPTSGLAVTPEKPSEPPHLRPTTRSETGIGSRRSCSAIGDQGLDGGQTVFQLVLDHLGREAAQAFAVDVRGRLQQGLQLVVLAAQAQDQHAAGVGVGGQARDQAAGVAEVVAQLRAAERVGEGVDAVDAAGEAGIGLLGDAAGGVGHAADGAQHPDLVAGADPAVLAAIAVEGRAGGRGVRFRRGRCKA
jgi:hypothetical protein